MAEHFTASNHQNLIKHFNNNFHNNLFDSLTTRLALVISSDPPNPSTVLLISRIHHSILSLHISFGQFDDFGDKIFDGHHRILFKFKMSSLKGHHRLSACETFHTVRERVIISHLLTKCALEYFFLIVEKDKF